MKKILAKSCSAAPFFILSGWKNVFEKIGYQWVWWPQDKSAFDIFGEYEPDIYIDPIYTFDRATLKCITDRPNLKVIMKGKNWGEIDQEIDTKKYPIDIVSENERKLLLELKEKTGKPDFLYNYYNIKDMPKTMGLWDKNGISTIDMQPAGDIYVYNQVDPNPTLKCQLSFIGGYWPYKAQNLDKYIRPLCHPVGKYNIKIFGNSIWPYPQYCGGLNTREKESELFASSDINLSISEPHSSAYGFEVPEKPFKLALSKAFFISDYIEGLKDVLLDCVMANNPQEYNQLIDYYLKIKNADEKQRHVENCYNNVIANHTYNHRIHSLLYKLGYQEDADMCINILRKEYSNDTNQ